MAAVEHQRCELLRGGAGGGAASVLKASDFLYLSGLHFHRRGFHQQACDGLRRDFDGRTWPLHGQHFHRTAVALDQVRRSALNAYADGCEARSGINSWMNFYNFRRPHQAMNNQMPMAVWRAGMDKIRRGEAVDMPLRLDNANALPTYPQQSSKSAYS